MANRRTDNAPLFTTPEVEPTFPSEDGGWPAFLQKNLIAYVPVTKGAKQGIYKVIVGFIVDTDGTIHDIKTFTNNGFGMEDEVVRMMKTSPAWVPAKQNNRNVTAYKKQAVTFIVPKS